jgi:hypothetical protein
MLNHYFRFHLCFLGLVRHKWKWTELRKENYKEKVKFREMRRNQRSGKQKQRNVRKVILKIFKQTNKNITKEKKKKTKVLRNKEEGARKIPERKDDRKRQPKLKGKEKNNLNKMKE